MFGQNVNDRVNHQVTGTIDALEPRMMLAADPTLGSVTFSKGLMTFNGTAALDDIYITISLGKVRVLNHYKEVAAFNPGQIKKMVINLGDGNDSLYIGNIFSGPTTINGGAGDDHLYCSTGNDKINAGDGNDYITALAGNDSVDAGAGDDLVTCGDGNDNVFGGDGRDRIFGDKGRDVIDGGFGADTMNGGEDVDTISYATRTNAVFVDPAGTGKGEQPDDGEAGEKDFVDGDFEIIVGGKGNDVLVGSLDANGNFGDKFIANNKLIGNAGNDTLIGLAGDDTMDGGAGADVFQGGDGADTADYSTRTDNLVITLDDVANDGAAATKKKAAEKDDVKSDIENVLGGKGSDRITGSAFANVLIGNAGNDIVRGGGGNDRVTGGAGVDQLFGDDGDDTIFAKDLGKLPKNAKDRAKAIAAAADKVDGGLGTDKGQYDIADKAVAGIETVLK
jgi:Ca2+-binding RTX toxin-like protein